MPKEFQRLIMLAMMKPSKRPMVKVDQTRGVNGQVKLNHMVEQN